MLVKNLQFNVQTSGEGGAVFWSHGLMASIASEDRMGLFEWDKFPMGKKLIRYDARGHGQTEPSYCQKDFHWRNLAADMLAISDKMRVQKFISGGQSMGCATALYASLIAPERIEKLVLMNPPTGWEKRAAQSILYKKMAYIGGLLGGEILAKLMAKRLDRLLPGWLIEARREQMKGVLEGLKPLKRRTLFNLFKGAATTDLPSRKELETVEIPTLILGWVGDRTHPVEIAIELNRLLLNSTLVVAEGYSDFKQWPQLIREFILESGSV